MAEFGNPTAQAQAAAGFVGQPVGQGGMSARDGAGGGGVAGEAGGAAVKQNEVPLDTMAGLLMGSPEFQRR